MVVVWFVSIPATAGNLNTDWGATALRLLLSGLLVLFAWMLATRARLLVRTVDLSNRLRPAELIGTLCGVAALSIGIVYVGIAWLHGMHAADTAWRAQRWTLMTLTVCSYTFIWTDPRRARHPTEQVMNAAIQAHPIQAAAGFLLGLAFFLPIAAAPLLPQPVRSLGLFSGLAVMLAEEVGGVWRLWRRGQRVGMTDIGGGARLPAMLTDPLMLGWIYGLGFFLLIVASLATPAK